MLNEFREFAIKGNMLDMAVGIILGLAFGTIVQSLVNDVIMPPVGLLLGDADFSDLFLILSQGAEPGPYATLADAQAAGAVTVNYGLFLNAVIAFVIVAFAVFLVVRSFNRLRRRQEDALAEGDVPEAEPPVQEKLLAEIRDLLQART